MVGLVIVSHSHKLAEALVNLVRQMAAPQVQIAVAAGVGPEREEFGTDAADICEAIQTVDSPDGVLILMDLGSAVLSAELALDLIPPEMASHVRLCPAPFVEGALAAGVQIGLGSDLDTVYQEAQQALLPKAEQLNVPAPTWSGTAAVETPPPAPASEGEQVVLTLKNQHGLHARPAARFVQTAAAFKADTRVTNLTTGKGPVLAKSLNALATLGAVQNHQIRIEARGPDAPQVLEALRALVETNFGESTEPEAAAPANVAAPAAAQPHGGRMAVPISEGIAIGPFYRYQPPLPPIPQELTSDPQKEWETLQNALSLTQRAIQQRKQQLRGNLGEEQAAIFDAHLLILQDPDLLAQVKERIEHHLQNAAAAWSGAIGEVAQSYQDLEDPYLRQRAADVLDVGNQVLFALAGRQATPAIAFQEPVVLFAEDLTPTETSQLDMSKVLGLLLVGGGPTSHSAILARALGIPAVSGVDASLGQLKAGTLVALDGSTGAVWIDPAEDVRAALQQQRASWLARRQELLATSHTWAKTKDGHRVEVFANVGNVQDAQAAVENGAEGVGLLRTEFLFLTRETPPSEEEQFAALSKIFAIMGDRPVTVRTLDVGGDKEVPYIHLPQEANPFLGVRAIRMCLNDPDLFLPQLRAILRAGLGGHLRIMFPMVANLDEVRQARAWVEKAHVQLTDEHIAHSWPVETGIMVEIPSAALLSPLFAKEVDFFSIGTNDLTQYTLAAERGNPLLSNLADALHPAVLRLIGEVATAAHQEGKWVGVCGELGGDPLAAAILVGLGVDELSLNPGGIPKVKATIRGFDLLQAKQLAAQAIGAGSAGEVRQMAREFVAHLSG